MSLKHEAPAYLGEEFPIILDVTNTDDRELDMVVDILLQPTEIEEAGMQSYGPFINIHSYPFVRQLY